MKPRCWAEFEMTAHFGMRSLTVDDVSEAYVGWLNDPQTTRYMPCVAKSGPVTIESQRDYVRWILDSEDACIMGLFRDSRLVGTSGAQRLGADSEFATIGVLIGSADDRGRGLGTAFVWGVTELLHSQLAMREVRATIAATNPASVAVFRKAGYSECGEVDGVITVRSVEGQRVEAARVGIRGWRSFRA